VGSRARTDRGEIFGDDVVAAAMIDRLVHHAEILALKGDSYRLRDRTSAPHPPATVGPGGCSAPPHSRPARRSGWVISTRPATRASPCRAVLGGCVQSTPHTVVKSTDPPAARSPRLLGRRVGVRGTD